MCNKTLTCWKNKRKHTHQITRRETFITTKRMAEMEANLRKEQEDKSKTHKNFIKDQKRLDKILKNRTRQQNQNLVVEMKMADKNDGKGTNNCLSNLNLDKGPNMTSESEEESQTTTTICRKCGQGKMTCNQRIHPCYLTTSDSDSESTSTSTSASSALEKSKSNIVSHEFVTYSSSTSTSSSSKLSNMEFKSHTEHRSRPRPNAPKMNRSVSFCRPASVVSAAKPIHIKHIKSCKRVKSRKTKLKIIKLDEAKSEQQEKVDNQKKKPAITTLGELNHWQAEMAKPINRHLLPNSPPQGMLGKFHTKSTETGQNGQNINPRRGRLKDIETEAGKETSRTGNANKQKSQSINSFFHSNSISSLTASLASLTYPTEKIESITKLVEISVDGVEALGQDSSLTHEDQDEIKDSRFSEKFEIQRADNSLVNSSMLSKSIPVIPYIPVIKFQVSRKRSNSLVCFGRERELGRRIKFNGDTYLV